MTDNEKIPYIKCLYHTGKKVYKWWAIALLLIGVIIALYFAISSAWKQIENTLTTIGIAFSYVGSIIISLINNAWSFACAVPWYWWVLFGVTVGPLILVAIWCALKHFNIDIGLFTKVIVTMASLFGVYNFISASINIRLNTIDIIIGFFSMLWIAMVFLCYVDDDNECDY